jgi:serine/threonine protein kinase
MARDMVQMMERLGFSRFSVAGHDRGGRVAYRMALNHPDRIARFEREAKVLASVNHPHIATLFGMEESAGRHFLVMELVEGETLAERIASPQESGHGQLRVEAALRVALQIAEALEAAHECGIIHRDLKPANIKITPDGREFGLWSREGIGGRPVEIRTSRGRRPSAVARAWHHPRDRCV